MLNLLLDNKHIMEQQLARQLEQKGAGVALPDSEKALRGA